MNTANTNTAATQAEQPALVKQIGKTTYKVKIHFSETSKETMSDKIVRMLKSEISQMQSLS
ncbi:MAG: transposon-encoded TnpW family protein [Oscillospiraceae bacterium]|nr:transposon-encoded TnpW family protein [Oscillospiraceae bacterium]